MTKTIFFSLLMYFIATGLLQPTAMAGGNPEEGRKIYENICISCHGEGGHPELPGIPAFADGERMDKTDEQIKKSIKMASMTRIIGRTNHASVWRRSSA
jgi:mono/diheme cytochrome c family protein